MCQERAEAERLFGGEEGQRLKREIQKSFVPETETELNEQQRALLRQALERAIRSAKSVDEISQLENALSSGISCFLQVPGVLLTC
jgi:hypothetical protein